MPVNRNRVLTWDSEGQENPGSIFHSRLPMVPSNNSGVTIGRGYDVKEKTEEEIENDFEEAGISSDLAEKYKQCIGLKGQEAKAKIKELGLDKCEITPEQQEKLFNIQYQREEATFERICNKEDVVKKYGKTDFQKLDPKIKQVGVDLKFRGDYRPDTRQWVQPLIVKNDAKAFQQEYIKRKDSLGKVPDRHQRRIDVLGGTYKPVQETYKQKQNDKIQQKQQTLIKK